MTSASPSASSECRTSTPAHVAILFHRIGPYHFARLKAAGAAVQVTAVEFSDVDPTYAWDLLPGNDGFARVTLFSGAPAETQSATRLLEVVNSTLDKLNPAVVVIPGWSDRCSLAALNWCSQRGVPAVMMSETTAWDDQRQPFREMVKKRLVRLCAAALAGGTPHAEYLVQLGMPRERIFLGYDAVDNGHFGGDQGTKGLKDQKTGDQETKRPKDQGTTGLQDYRPLTTDHRPLTTDHGPAPPSPFFLASARFVEKKNLSRLIEAYALYRNMSKAVSRELKTERAASDFSISAFQNFSFSSAPWFLVLLGDGPLRPALISQLSTLNLHAHVHMPGFKQYDELPAYYASASVFIHASTVEQWGLVVNEAMAAGLPVLVSNRCGCARDLVRDGVNGFTFDPYNVEELAELMLRMSQGGSQMEEEIPSPTSPSSALPSPLSALPSPLSKMEEGRTKSGERGLADHGPQDYGTKGLQDHETTGPQDHGSELPSPTSPLPSPLSALPFPFSALDAMGRASRDIIADWGPERFAKGLQAAVEVAVGAPRPRPGLLDRSLLRLLLLVF